MSNQSPNPNPILQAIPDASIGRGKWNKWELEAQERIKARTKVEAANNPIQRVYFTRGDKVTDLVGLKADKRAAIEVDDKIYWLKPKFTHLWQLSNALELLGISISDDGEWGFWEGNRAPLRNNVVQIARTHKDIFASDSKYHVLAQKKDRRFWWTLEEVKAEILDPIEEKTTRN